MINAWSLAAEVLEGTLDETFPIKKSTGQGSRISTERYEHDCDSQQRQDCLQSLHEQEGCRDEA